MNLRKKTRPTPLVRSDDDHQATNRSNGGSQEDADDDNDILQPPRKKHKNRRLCSSEEMGTSEDEEIINPVNHIMNLWKRTRPTPLVNGTMNLMKRTRPTPLVRSDDDYQATNRSNGGSHEDADDDNDILQPPRKKCKNRRLCSSEDEEIIHPVNGTMNLRMRTRPTPLVRSDDDYQANQSNGGSHEDAHDDNNIHHLLRKKCKHRRLYTFEEVDSSEDEIVRSVRHGTMRALSDYDAGTSSVYISGASERNSGDSVPMGEDPPSVQPNVIPTNSGVFVAEHCEQRSDFAESCSSSGVTLSSRNKRKRVSNVVSSSDSYDSDVSIAPLRLQRRRNQIHSTDDEFEEFPVRNRVRRSSAIPINESDNDETKTAESRNEDVPSPTSEKTIKPSSGLGRSSESDGESETCPLCLEGFNEQEVGVPSTCEHSFCLVCIQEWAKIKNTCPLDRKQFNQLLVFNKAHSTIARHIAIKNPDRFRIERFFL